LHQILSLLNKDTIVKETRIIKLTMEEDIQRICLKVTIKDGSLLFIRETTTFEFEDYSYHWQNKKGNLLARWDNAGHFKNLDTFPHHLHVKNKRKALPAKKPTIKNVLDYIKSNIK